MCPTLKRTRLEPTVKCNQLGRDRGSVSIYVHPHSVCALLCGLGRSVPDLTVTELYVVLALHYFVKMDTFQGLLQDMLLQNLLLLPRPSRIAKILSHTVSGYIQSYPEAEHGYYHGEKIRISVQG